jgi:hypothetical protein
VADRPTVYRAILDAAVTVDGATGVDLQLYDRNAQMLRMAVQHGFPSEFVVFFAAVGTATPTACATALATLWVPKTSSVGCDLHLLDPTEDRRTGEDRPPCSCDCPLSPSPAWLPSCGYCR